MSIFSLQIPKNYKITQFAIKYNQSSYKSIFVHLLKKIITMGGCIQKCCLSEVGTICCNIISVLGIIYFVFTWAMFDRQFNYFEFHIPDKSQTKLAVIVSALIYLMFFIWTLYRLFKINKQKKIAAQIRHKRSVEQYNNVPSVYEEPDKQAPVNSERAMMREN